MVFPFMNRIRPKRTGRPVMWMIVISFMMVPVCTHGQTWSWTKEDVDGWGKFTSIAVDQGGNIHLSYAGDGGSVLKYAFRSAGSAHWFTMVLDKQLQDFATNLATDSHNNPSIATRRGSSSMPTGTDTSGISNVLRKGRAPSNITAPLPWSGTEHPTLSGITRG